MVDLVDMGIQVPAGIVPGKDIQVGQAVKVGAPVHLLDCKFAGKFDLAVEDIEGFRTDLKLEGKDMWSIKHDTLAFLLKKLFFFNLCLI